MGVSIISSSLPLVFALAVLAGALGLAAFFLPADSVTGVLGGLRPSWFHSVDAATLTAVMLLESESGPPS